MPVEDEQAVKYFSNQALFSDHYLAERMDAHPEWAEDIGDAFAQLQALYKAKRDILDGLNEAQTEEEFIRPALEMLGFAYIPQTGFTRAGRQLRPDYALFADEAAKTEAYRFLKDEGKFYPRSLAICDAKYWGRLLDIKREADPRDEFKNTNPSFQIVNYLVGTDVDWGILTNGRLWRLYYQKARSRASTYYEIDLGLILEREDLEAFRYFYHFFRQEALVKDPATDRNFLERVYEGSATYALQVQEELKGLIFERIVPILAEGFVAWRRAELGITQEAEDSLHQIFTATLTLLYRLLFLLYAESRDLLPVSDRLGYYRYSLTRLKREAMARLGREEVFSTVSDDLWNDLAALFRIIDRGDPALNVPTYNGGLFDRRSPKNAFLEEHRIADYYLVQALDLLTRRDDPDADERRFIDYKDLDVRHLGSIYEGLLEFYLRIAQEDLAAVKERGVEVYKPLSEVSESRRLGVVRQGELYLENDKGQRKATGSYYTPDYIVKYIVANTLGPIMDEREAAFAEAMTEWEVHWDKLVRAEEKLQEYEGQPGRWQTYWTNRRNEYRLALQTVEAEALKALLDVKVCDPAMGSGHFLVEAVAYLTDRIIDILNQYPENPVLARLAAIREQILANLEEQGIRIDPGVLTDTNLLKRMVMKRCIYGVDLNPMAVELAKLSLWLDSFTVGAPLSFLDHHLKVGNSLIGARVQEVRSELEKTPEGQYDMFGGPFAGLLTATELMRGVGLRTDATFDEVQESAELYAGFERAILPYKRVLDLWVSKYFGNERAEELLRLYGTEALRAVMNEGEGLTPEHQQAVKTARQLWEEKRFFHWDLEFPEVFIDLERATWKENPGFDAIVGNPPYFLLQGTDLQKPLSKICPDIFSGSNDVSHFFLAGGAQLLREKGSLSYIVTRYWIEAHLSDGLRRFLTTYVQPSQIIDFGNLQVWPDVNVLTIVCQFVKSSVKTTEVYMADESRYSTAIDFFNAEVLDSGHKPREVETELFDSDPWYLRAIESAAIWQKIRRCSVTLDEITENTQGIKTGNNDVFVVSPETVREFGLEEEFLIPVAQAQYVRRYEIRTEEFVIYTDGSFEIDDTPAIKSYLSQFKEELSKRAEVNRGAYPWWRLQRPRDREMLLQGERILAPLYATENRFFFSDEVIVGMTDVYIIVVTDRRYEGSFISAVLNSQLLNRYHSNFCKIKRAGYLEYSGNAISNLPIRRIEFTTQEEERRGLVEKAVNEWVTNKRMGEQGFVYSFAEFVDSPLGRWLDARLTADPEQADVVHDLLAYLAEQMIEMHKEKQAEAKGFLDWLADYTGLPIDNWKLKSRVRVYWEHPWSELQRALHQNRKRMRRDVEGREAQERIKREFGDSMAKLVPLLARIEATDRLIDQIVYRLYGLREEEVAVVEGRP